MYHQALSPFGATLPTLVTAQHSQIRQQADYIRERINAAQVLHARLASEIKKAEKKLQKGRQDGILEGATDSLKKDIRKRRSRLNRCARNQAVYEERLVAILTEMRSLEQRQWRRSMPQLYVHPATIAGPVAIALFQPGWATANMPQPTTPALGPSPMLPWHMQSHYHPVVGYLPRTPVLEPILVSQSAFTQPAQQVFGRFPIFDEMDISPTDTVSPYDLNPLNGFPAVQRADLVEAVDNLQISQSRPSTQRAHDTYMPHHSNMLDHQSAAIRLQKAASKPKHQRSC